MVHIYFENIHDPSINCSLPEKLWEKAREVPNWERSETIKPTLEEAIRYGVASNKAEYDEIFKSWTGHYLVARAQRVTEENALSLAASLERELKRESFFAELKKEELDHLEGFIDLCKRGSFRIRCESEPEPVKPSKTPYK